jgi:heme-degrading monooxygenase HmoA
MVAVREQTGNQMAYVIVWEFRVRRGRAKQFEEAYGPHGEWVRLFRQDPAFIRTELIQDVHDASRYLTLDFWASEEAYQAFRESRRDEYKFIDARCEQTTKEEREVGRFSGFDTGARLRTKVRRSRAKKPRPKVN